MRKTLIDLRGNRSQNFVADAIGITQQYLSAIELGKQTPSVAVMIEFEKFYKVPINVMFIDIFKN